MAVKKMIPIRGMMQDWYGDKEHEILKKNEEYALRSINNNLLGSPPFEEYKTFLIKPGKSNKSNLGKRKNRREKK